MAARASLPQLGARNNHPLLVKPSQAKAKERRDALERWSARQGPDDNLPRNVKLDADQVASCTLAILKLMSSCRTVDSDGHSHYVLAFPPATLCLTLVSVGVFLLPGGVPFRRVANSPFCILEKRQLDRVVLSTLVHADLVHLLGNLAGMIPDCEEMENQLGSRRMAVQLVELTALSSALHVSWAGAAMRLLSRPDLYYRVGAVGLSSLAFAVQVTSRASSTLSANLEFLPEDVTIPLKYLWALHVLLSHVTSPRSFLTGHMCGVVAGLLHCHVITPALGALTRRTRTGCGHAQDWEGGCRAGGARAHGWGGQRRFWQRAGFVHHAKELGVQGALAAAVIGVCTAIGRRRIDLRRFLDLVFK